MSKDERYNRMIRAKEWQRLRRRKITANPLCERCLESGIYTPATEVHHRLPVEDAISYEGMKARMYDFNNLESLCHDCHVIRHKELHSHTAAAVRERNNARNDRFKKKFLA